MMRRRRSKSASPMKEWSASRVTLTLALIVVVAIKDSRSEYLMGGHLDNKEDHEGSPAIARISDGEPENDARRSTVISSRTAMNLEDLDRDFDLGLDLLAEQSAVDPSRTSMSSSSSEHATTDGEEPEIVPRYRVPLVPYAFNGGQPFSLEKDPITGQIDFEKAPPLKVLDYTAKSPEDDSNDDTTGESSETFSNADSKAQTDEGVSPNEINPYSPSFHDFLNLPVRYTYNKYDNSEKYPLISNSYANTKVQSGTNSYNTYNHKKYHESVKASVDVHLQPSRKTHIQSVMRTTTRNPSTESSVRFTATFTTPRPTTTTTEATTTTTTTPAPTTITTTTTKRLATFPLVTTWKPNRLSGSNKYPGEDYEGTLPIERLQPVSSSDQQLSTEPSRYAAPPSRPSNPVKIHAEDNTNEEYEEGYEDYDRIFPSDGKPTAPNDQNDSEGDYSYGLDFFGMGSRPSMKPSQTTTEKVSISTISTAETTASPSTTYRPVTSAPTNKIPDRHEDRQATTSKPSPVEEKRVTSMPLDTSDHYIINYGNNGQVPATIDNSIPSVTSNVVYHQLRPSSNDQYYGRPSMGMSAPGIVVKSTSNVVVPPGQDTVSFVLGNRQSVGGGDSGGEYYPVHSGSINDRPGISFGKIGSSRPVNNADNYPGQMVVSAGIGVGSNPGVSYSQRPQPNGNLLFDHALVSVGLPTVDVVNPGDNQPIGNKNSESSTSNSVDSLAQKWWASTSSSNAKPQQNLQQEPANQHHKFGYHVLFPDEQNKPSGSVANEKPPGSIEEHVIVVHETEIGAGNTLHLEVPSQLSTTTSPTTGFYYETTTQRFAGKPEDHGLPELSESLTPPAERPNRVQQGHRPSNYNYYHHQSHSPGNSRPSEYPRPQRVPLSPPSSSSSSPSNGFKRRPPSSLDSNLPNILPQFRPNAKVSHGHNRGDNAGTIPAGSLAHYPNPIIRRPPPHHHLHRPNSLRRPTGPSHLQRLNPPPLPPPPPPITSLRLPTPAALIGPTPGTTNQHDVQVQNNDNVMRLTVQKRLHQVSVGVPPSLNIDERHQSSSFDTQQPQQIKSRLEDDNLERFSAEPPQQPPRAPFFSKRTPITGSIQLPEGIPRVATLQMIQQHGGDDSIVKTNLPPPYRFNLDNRQSNRPEGDTQDTVEENSRPSINRRGDESLKDSSVILPLGDEDTRTDYVDSANSPVYVVYPVKGALDIRPTSHEDDENDSEDASVVLGKYGPQRPLPPDTLLKDSNDDSATDDHQGYRPSGTPYTDSSFPQLASDFPYPLERPDPSIFTSQLREKPILVPSEHQKNNQDEKKTENGESEDNADEESSHDIDRDASVNIIPYPQDHIPFGLAEHSGAISATLHRLGGFSSIVDSSSTPIAYVYTPTMRPPIRRPEEGYAHASFERAPVLLQSQHASSTNSGPAAPQSFMAPFVASASAEAPTKNGWSVVMLEKSPSADSTSMDRHRADTIVQSDANEEVSSDDKEENDENEDEEKDETKSDAIEQKKDEETDKETQTEKSEFNVENFTPQLFGGFKPIFEFPSDTDTDPSLGDKVSGGALAIERPRSETETAKITERKLENV